MILWWFYDVKSILRTTSLPQPAAFKLLGRKQRQRQERHLQCCDESEPWRARSCWLDRMQTTCFYCCSPCFLATVPILWVISFRVHSFNNLIKYIIEDAIKNLIFQISWLPALHCTSDSLCFTFMESTSQQPSAFASRKFSDSSAQPVGLGIWPIALPTIDQTRCAYKIEYQDCQLTKVLSGSSRS